MPAFSVPATSATLSGTLPAATVIVLGQRVVIPDTAFTVGASVTSYLDLSNAGVLTVSTSSTVTANSLRLWSVVSSATAITGVTQVAPATPAAAAAAPKMLLSVATSAAGQLPTLATSTTGGTLAASLVCDYYVTPVYANGGEDVAGNFGASPFSSITTGTTTTNSNTLTWTAVSGAVSYNVYGRGLDSSYAGILANTTALTWTDTGSVTPANGAWPNGIGGAFTTIKTPIVATDPLSGWDAANNQYNISQSGTYLVVTRLRFSNVGLKQGYSLAANGSAEGGNIDGIFNQWFTSANYSYMADAINVRIAQFPQGDLISMYSYTSGSELYYYTAQMDIYLLEAS
jgi:hypothetical protein